ncbi:MAG: hypothetical protein DME50_04170 [Verrucomicrobia bacterium]|nr:MAG: hypothetical protein DME85_13290 [Verrucomicrobiota bacterium]PYK66909.1 MAG: hypothetical protein DME50_04170 [Verrucomicrobiota bacterium]
MLSERPHQWEHEQNWQNADKYPFWFHDAFLRDLLKRRYDIGAIRPATSMVEVRALIDPKMLVEIEAEAIASR